jgi:hypothetical protein
VRRFPVLFNDRERREHPDCPRSIPWDVIAPHEAQAQKNHSQTLERLANRGGLHPKEIVAVMLDRPWREMVMAVAVEFVKQQAGKAPTPTGEVTP